MKKKGFTLVEMIAVVMILAIIVVLAVPPILQWIRSTKNEISDAMKKIIVSASDLYMDNDKNNYIRYNGNRYCITLRQLVESEKLTSPIYDPTTGDEISQDKFVKVDIFDNEYSYEIVDSCEEIRIKTLVTTLKQDCKAENTVGLIQDTDGTCYYKGTNGQVNNNFVWFGGHLWRVLTVNTDDTVTMITGQPITAISPVSVPWTTEEEYQNSYINTWLNEVFLGSMNSNDKMKIQDNIFNVGVYNNVTEIQTIQKLGLLDTEQYIKAGGQDSFLDIKDTFWLGNRYDTSKMQDVFFNGILMNHVMTNNSYSIRVVVKVSDLIIIEGEGTIDNPYREKSTSSSTTNIKVGEYISVPTSGTDCGSDNRCLFRVVSKDDDSIKVTLNGLLPNTSVFDEGGNTTYTSESTINTELMTFANTIDNKYRYIGNKDFNIGTYNFGADYTDVQKTKYTGNIGLPVVGEIFSANDIDMVYSSNNSRVFVNVNTIENPGVADFFWTMNQHGSLYVRTVDGSGDLYVYRLNGTRYGVRPVMFLKNNLNFASGEGTAENPFILE